MTMLPLAEVRAQLSRLVEEAERTHERIEVTKNGRRAAVILSAGDYDSIMETLDILSDSDLVVAIREGMDDRERGEVYSAEEVEAELKARGRLRR